MSREWLLRAVKFMFALLVLAFVWVFARGIGGIPQDRIQPAETNLKSGQAVIRTINGQRRWLIWPSEQQLAQAASLQPFLHDPQPRCATLGGCQLDASTGRAGIDISFSLARPPQLSPDVPWFGGFVDPVSGAVYDRLGRAYRLAGDTPQQNLTILKP